MAATDIGTGAAITFSSGFFAELTDISWDGVERESVETSHMGSSVWRSFIPGDLTDPGELSAELNMDPDATPPMTAPETITLTFPTPAGGVSGATWSASGFMTSHSAAIPLEDKMVLSVTIKFSGAITYVDSA